MVILAENSLQRWSAERAAQWQAAQPWIVGCNFIPSTAANQLEMWGAATFDPATIARELGFAQGLGFNAIRVYLHDLAWTEDEAGFKARLDQFLDIAKAQDIRALLVLFDDCWYEPQAGEQAPPRPGIHNSRWLRSPGHRALADPSEWGRLADYVRDIVSTHAHDARVLAWDVYNEVTNIFLPALGKGQPWQVLALFGQALRRSREKRKTLAFLTRVFDWARSAQPMQPLTSSIWLFPDTKLNEQLVALSDIVSFHHYDSPKILQQRLSQLKRYGRPLYCTEYMARSRDCLFENHLPIFKQEGIGCFNWGLVDGKTQTKFSWASRKAAEPDPWFHDILHKDGTPYRESEARLIRQLTGARAGEA